MPECHTFCVLFFQCYLQSLQSPNLDEMEHLRNCALNQTKPIRHPMLYPDLLYNG